MTLDELKKLCEAATPGPWTIEHRYAGCLPNETNLDLLLAARECGLGGTIVESPEPDRGQLDAVDAAFIAAIRNAAPALIAVAEAARDWAVESREDLGHDKMNLTFLVQALAAIGAWPALDRVPEAPRE